MGGGVSKRRRRVAGNAAAVASEAAAVASASSRMAGVWALQLLTRHQLNLAGNRAVVAAKARPCILSARRMESQAWEAKARAEAWSTQTAAELSIKISWASSFSSIAAVVESSAQAHLALQGKRARSIFAACTAAKIAGLACAVVTQKTHMCFRIVQTCKSWAAKKAAKAASVQAQHASSTCCFTLYSDKKSVLQMGNRIDSFMAMLGVIKAKTKFLESLKNCSPMASVAIIVAAKRAWQAAIVAMQLAQMAIKESDEAQRKFELNTKLSLKQGAQRTQLLLLLQEVMQRENERQGKVEKLEKSIRNSSNNSTSRSSRPATSKSKATPKSTEPKLKTSDTPKPTSKRRPVPSLRNDKIALLERVRSGHKKERKRDLLYLEDMVRGQQMTLDIELAPHLDFLRDRAKSDRWGEDYSVGRRHDQQRRMIDTASLPLLPDIRRQMLEEQTRRTAREAALALEQELAEAESGADANDNDVQSKGSDGAVLSMGSGHGGGLLSRFDVLKPKKKGPLAPITMLASEETGWKDVAIDPNPPAKIGSRMW